MKILSLLLLVAATQIKGASFLGSTPKSSAQEIFELLCEQSIRYSTALKDNASNPKAREMIDLLNSCVNTYTALQNIIDENNGIAFNQIGNSVLASLGLVNKSDEQVKKDLTVSDAIAEQAKIIEKYKNTLKSYINKYGNCPPKDAKITKLSTKDQVILNADDLKANVERAIKTFEKEKTSGDHVGLNNYEENVKIDINKNNKNKSLQNIYNRILTLDDINKNE